jgi:hypothetical protein
MMGGHDIKKVTNRMREAAMMAACGIAVPEIAKHFKVDETSVRAWLRNPEVKELYISHLQTKVLSMVGKAVNVLDKQMESGKANGFLAQNAANSTLSKYGAPMLEDKNDEVRITFINGTIPLGMPEDTSGDA